MPFAGSLLQHRSWSNPVPAPVPRCYETGWGDDGGVTADPITMSLFSRFPITLPPSRQTRVRFSPPFPPCTSIHPFTVIPFRVTPFSRCGPRYHSIVIYRSGIAIFFWLRPIFRSLICALFVFGNRLLKTTHSHPHPHAVATLRTSGTISISRF